MGLENYGKKKRGALVGAFLGMGAIISLIVYDGYNEHRIRKNLSQSAFYAGGNHFELSTEKPS